MKKTILMIHTQNSSFVKRDYQILSKYYNVLAYTFIPRKKPLLLLWELIKEKWYILKNIRNIDVFFVWFADYHSFLPVMMSKVFGKKSYLLLGGYDVVNLPEFNYGSFNNPIRGFLAKNSMKICSLNLPVCDNIAYEAKKIVNRLNYKIIYTGYDEAKFRPGVAKEKIVLLVSIIDSEKRFYIKGIDFFLKLANFKHNVKFVAVGIHRQFIPPDAAKNITFYDVLPEEELLEFYQKSKVIALFSRREGLPNSLCEGMLCGCVPFGPKVGGIPTAIGQTGYLYEPNNLEDAARKLDAALASEDLGKIARQRIIENFSLKKREEKLLEIIG